MRLNNSILGLNSFLASINDGRVKRLTIGPYWIVVEAEYGTGLVANPQTKISANSVKEYQKKYTMLNHMRRYTLSGNWNIQYYTAGQGYKDWH